MSSLVVSKEIHSLHSLWHTRPEIAFLMGFAITHVLHQSGGCIAEVEGDTWLWALVLLEVVLGPGQGLRRVPGLAGSGHVHYGMCEVMLQVEERSKSRRGLAL